MLCSHYSFLKILHKSLSAALLNLHTLSNMVYTASNLEKFLLNTDLRTASSLARVRLQLRTVLQCVSCKTHSLGNTSDDLQVKTTRSICIMTARGTNFTVFPGDYFFYCDVKYLQYLSIFINWYFINFLCSCPAWVTQFYPTESC